MRSTTLALAACLLLAVAGSVHAQSRPEKSDDCNYKGLYDDIEDCNETCNSIGMYCSQEAHGKCFVCIFEAGVCNLIADSGRLFNNEARCEDTCVDESGEPEQCLPKGTFCWTCPNGNCKHVFNLWTLHETEKDCEDSCRDGTCTNDGSDYSCWSCSTDTDAFKAPPPTDPSDEFECEVDPDDEPKCCDGKTYDNQCEAQKDGLSWRGDCEDGRC